MSLRLHVISTPTVIACAIVATARAADIPLESPKNHGGFNAFAFSPDGKVIAGGTGAITESYDDGRKNVTGGEVILWDARSGKIRRNLGTHGSSVNWVAFSTNGTVLASASVDNGVLKIWDGKTGVLRQTLKAPDGLGTTSNGRGRICALSGDGKSIATVAVKKSPMGKQKVRAGDQLLVWDTSTGRPRWQLAESNVHALAFSADGVTIAAFAMKVDWKPSADGSTSTGTHSAQRFVAWDTVTGKERFGSDAMNSSPSALAFVPTVGLIAVDLREFLVLDPATGSSRKKIKLETRNALRGLVFSGDGERFAAARFMGDGIELGETATGKTTGVQEFKADRFSNVAFSADLKRAAGARNSTPTVIDVTPAAAPTGK